jgi:hypothetical protein
MSLKKLALWFLIASVAISAALGIVAILTGNFGQFEIRIVLTTLTISAASICALASGALWEGRGQRVLPSAGIVLALLAAALLITGIWFEPHSEQFWKLTASIGVVAAATAHACLVSLAKLAQRFGWARVITLIAIYLLAFLIVVSIYIEPQGDLGFRLIGTTSIVVAALTIMMPIFHRLSREDLSLAAGKLETVDRGLFATITCPQCGAIQPNSLTETECDKCGCRFVLKILVAGRRT